LLGDLTDGLAGGFGGLGAVVVQVAVTVTLGARTLGARTLDDGHRTPPGR
jgi:hypothetical protein